jgi:subtilisin family serine protease
MPSFLLALIKTRLRVVVVISTCLAVLALGSLVFPSHSRARVEPTAQERGSGKRKRAPYVKGEVLVRYRSEASAKSRTGSSSVMTREGFAIPVRVERFDGSDLVKGLRRARVPVNQTLQAVAALRSQPDVLYAEPNYILHADITPNDTSFAQQYGLTKIGAPSAWNTNTGSSSVVIGIIDQGIDINHEDLAANIWTNPAPGSILPGPGETAIVGDLHGYNFVDNSGTVFSGLAIEDHASHVAGIAGAVGNNNNGVSGVNWSVGLMSLKFLDADGVGETSDAIRACTYARKMRDLWETSGHTKGANIRVLNASFGGGSFSQSFLDALTELSNTGILFVAAAGNIDEGTTEPNNDLVPHYPSSFNVPNIIAVGATNTLDQIPAFSHFGATSVDLGAPGEGILSTTPGPVAYKSFSGTSMSAPHVSGAAALLWAQNPNLTVTEVKNLLLLNGDIQASLIDKTLTGRRLNVGKSFQSLAEGDTTAPGIVGGFSNTSQSVRTINLGWTASGDNGASDQASLYQVELIDGSSGVVIPLKGVIPAPSGTAQSTSVKIPFRHTSGTLRLREFDNAGNEGTPAILPFTIPLAFGDPYTISIGSPAGLSTGGDRLNVNADDVYSEFLFPGGFTFPFFGEVFTGVTISSNGSLYFSEPPRRNNGDADDVPSSTGALGAFKMIAGLWDDLDLRNSRRGDSGIYVVPPTADHGIIFRWQGVPCEFNFDTGQCTGTLPVNFEIELRGDGTIKIRYGAGNIGLLPTVGVGGGEPDGYVVRNCADSSTLLPCYTSEDEQHPINLTNAPEVIFAGPVVGPTPTPTPTPSATPSPTPTPTPAPLQLILEDGGPSITQAAALDAMLFVRDMFPVFNSSNQLNTGFDPNTRVVVFVNNLTLLPGEQSSDVSVHLEVGGMMFTVPAEDVRAVATFGFAQIIFRLPTNLPVGICTITVTAHGQTSNIGTVRIRAG